MLSLEIFIRYVNKHSRLLPSLGTHLNKLIPFEDDIDMQTNPYVMITSNVSQFNPDDRSFTLTPTQYIILTHTTSPFPIWAHFADTNSKKRWGTDGLKVAIGSTITLGGSLQQIVRERNIDRTFEFAQVEVTTIAYLITQSNLAGPPSHNTLNCIIYIHSLFFISLEDQFGSPKTKKRWSWRDLQKPSLQSQPTLPPTNDPSSSLTSKKEKTWWWLWRHQIQMGENHQWRVGSFLPLHHLTLNIKKFCPLSIVFFTQRQEKTNQWIEQRLQHSTTAQKRL